MKKFSFSLDRVLAWRRLQQEQERAQLERLVSERTAIADRADALRADRSSSEKAFAASLHFDAYQVATLSSWQAKVKATLASLAIDCAAAENRIAQQRIRVSTAERSVRLLERLRERRLAHWRSELNREEEAFAAEAYLARCIRLKKVESAGA